MHRVREQAAREYTARPCFPEWASNEVERLLRLRRAASTPEERAQLELQLAVVTDAADRYGRSLVEMAEL